MFALLNGQSNQFMCNRCTADQFDHDIDIGVTRDVEHIPTDSGGPVIMPRMLTPSAHMDNLNLPSALRLERGSLRVENIERCRTDSAYTANPHS
jgi:hypothetical protein